MERQAFVNYVMDFYGPNGVYPEYDFKESQVHLALGIHLGRLGTSGGQFSGDSVDREAVRDIIMSAREITAPEYRKQY